MIPKFTQKGIVYRLQKAKIGEPAGSNESTTFDKTEPTAKDPTKYTNAIHHARDPILTLGELKGNVKILIQLTKGIHIIFF